MAEWEMPMQPIPRTPALIRYSRIAGARFFVDGNTWCAVFPDFVNQEESPIGFGDTQMDALVNLLVEAIEKKNVKIEGLKVEILELKAKIPTNQVKN